MLKRLLFAFSSGVAMVHAVDVLVYGTGSTVIRDAESREAIRISQDPQGCPFYEVLEDGKWRNVKGDDGVTHTPSAQDVYRAPQKSMSPFVTPGAPPGAEATEERKQEDGEEEIGPDGRKKKKEDGENENTDGPKDGNGVRSLVAMTATLAGIIITCVA
jgi:hypothetical protein